MDLKTLTDEDLGALLEVFRDCAKAGNRFFYDMYIIIERESVSRHMSTEIEHYSDGDVVEVIQRMTSLVDDLRAQGMPDDYASLRFVLENLTVAIEEAERRDLVKPIQ